MMPGLEEGKGLILAPGVVIYIYDQYDSEGIGGICREVVGNFYLISKVLS